MLDKDELIDALKEDEAVRVEGGANFIIIFLQLHSVGPFFLIPTSFLSSEPFELDRLYPDYSDCFLQPRSSVLGKAASLARWLFCRERHLPKRLESTRRGR